MSIDRLESLLSPLSAESPCGVDPAYDPAMLALQDASVRKSEQQFGKTVIPAQDPDWRTVHQQASALVERTRDLRAAVLYARSAARVEGLPGAVMGLRLVRGLVERHWDDVHPRLDASEGNDPTARVNALTPLAHPEAGLADFRSASLTGKAGAVTVRDIELVFGRGQPVAGESMPTEEGVLQGVRAAIAASPTLAPLMLEACETGRALGACLEGRFEAGRAPDLEALQKLLQRVAEIATRVGGTAEPSIGGGDAGADATASGALAVPAGLRSREDVITALERACEWIERNEPTNPAPLLIRRSQRLMTKSFVDIIRDLVPESVAQIEKLAGQGKS